MLSNRVEKEAKVCCSIGQYFFASSAKTKDVLSYLFRGQFERANSEQGFPLLHWCGPEGLLRKHDDKSMASSLVLVDFDSHPPNAASRSFSVSEQACRP